jgi:predicted transcriptional regulator of viral defense system
LSTDSGDTLELGRTGARLVAVDPALEAIADRRLGVFTAQEALGVGLTVDDIKAELRSRRWVRLRKGIYTSSVVLAAAEDRDRHLLACIAVLLSLDPGPALSHASSARVHGLVVPSVSGSDVRLTDDEQWRSGRGYRVARAQLTATDVRPWLSFRATSVPRTLVDCAREWSQLDSVIAMDAAMHAKLATRPELLAAVLSARHRPGVARAARALHLADGRAESPLETKGRLRLLASGLPLPELQVDLHDEHGFVGRVDAWYEEAALALEFDGWVKYADPRDDRTPAQVAWEEKRREDRIRATDVRVVRIVNDDLGPSWSRVAGRIRNLLATPYAGRRRFRIVRNPEPGASAA